MTCAKSLLYDLIIILISSILSLLFVPTLPFILIYRVFIVKCAQCVRPDLEVMVSGADLIFAKDIGRWDTKPEEIIVLTITLKSSLSFEKVHAYFEEAVAEKNNERLCQYMVPWMGFAFWKRETDFSLENHIFVVDGNNGRIQDNKWLDSFTKTLLRKPFGRMQSPWDIYIIPNYQSAPGNQNESAFIIRHHHSLLDGHSLLKLFANAYDDYMPIKYESSHKTISYSKIATFTTWLLIPYKLLKNYFQVTDCNTNHWNKFTGEMCAASVKIPMEKILLIRQKYNVSVDAIFYAGVADAFRNIFLRNYCKIPRKIHIGFPVPKPHHPEHLCNHYTALSFPLPIGTSDPLARLDKINSDRDDLFAAGIPDMLDKVQEILGLLPFSLIHMLKIRLAATVSFVAYGDKREFFGCPIGEYNVSFPVPISHTNSGMVIFCLLNDGCLHIRGTVDKSILASDKRVKEILEGIDEYYDSLLIN